MNSLIDLVEHYKVQFRALSPNPSFSAFAAKYPLNFTSISFGHCCYYWTDFLIFKLSARHTLPLLTIALSGCLSCRNCGYSGLAADTASSFGFKSCNYFSKWQNHFSYALLHCFNSCLHSKYLDFEHSMPVDFRLTELSVTMSNCFQDLRYFYLLKLVYFVNEIFEVFMIDHFIDFAVGTLYLYLNAIFSFFITAEISKSFDCGPQLNFNKQLLYFVCFKIDYSWSYQQWQSLPD